MLSPGSAAPTGDMSRLPSSTFLDKSSKMKENANKTAMDKELHQLRLKMDSKLIDLKHLETLVEKNKPAAHILENVMAELEQKNSELVSLYRSSEKNRLDMVAILKEQNQELRVLRANTETMRTLEVEITGLTEKKVEIESKIKDRDHEFSQARKQEQSMRQRYREVERQCEQTSKDYSSKIEELTSKINWANEQIIEKDAVIDKTESTTKELFEKCQQLGVSNSDIKKELDNCVESGNRLVDINTKLQYCKSYLEEQLEILINELRLAQVENEELKIEYSNVNTEKVNFAKNIVLIKEELSQSASEIAELKEILRTMQNDFKDYESGKRRSAAVINEINKEKRAREDSKEQLEKKLWELESKRDVHLEELKSLQVQEKKQNIRIMEMESKITFYQMHFIEKQELHKMKADLEVKYKLDMNNQMKKINAYCDRQSEDLSNSLKASLALREEAESGMSIPTITNDYSV